MSMPTSKNLPSNFSMLQPYAEQLWRLGALAERYFAEDPNTSLLKLRQFAENLAQSLAARAGLYNVPGETQYALLRRLYDEGVLPQQSKNLFDQVRINGNAANHALAGDHRSALASLKLCWQLALWFHRTFQDPQYKSGPFLPPTAPVSGVDPARHLALQEELEKLREQVQNHMRAQEQSTSQLQAVHTQLSKLDEERSIWEQIATEAEQGKAQLAQQLTQLQQAAQASPNLPQVKKAAQGAAKQVELDEADTRKLIDQQLREAGWEADTQLLKYSKGARPQKGKNQAIAEWPCAGGYADYVLFQGTVPLAVIEAKRKSIDVSAALQQAKRYSRSFEASAETALHTQNWGEQGEFRIPFAFASNGRPYLRQLDTKSGIWFADLRQPLELSRALQGWYTPQGLQDLFNIDIPQAQQKLAQAAFDYGFSLREYQITAIRAVEDALQEGQRNIMLAMATGTGKTKTCIALMYRLLKSQRFKRVLFLVDRSALGEQAANAFKDTRMENLQTFAETFHLAELKDKQAARETDVHIATVQGMVKRVLYAEENQAVPAINTYDCIVVDECHRGYVLDREMSDTELSFRDFSDYISQYRRILDYFDAVKIGMTATPAQHSVDIFGLPVYQYGYREAVIDGYLVDYEPPVNIRTKLSEEGICWEVQSTVNVLDVKQGTVQSYVTPDEIKIEVEDFNRKVISESFNQVVCTALTKYIYPDAEQKTLIFCTTDAHADQVVKLLKAAFADKFGSVEDDAVIKITGAQDKPLELIRRFRNERLPNVAVTVDLLTTGVDIPKICNLVFLRRVNSRILFDQMMGRATRLCDFEDGPKGPFRIFDAVRQFDALEGIEVMKPVVVDPKLSFSQLQQELQGKLDEAARQLAKEQFLAKLQNKKRHLDAQARQDFETQIGMAPEDFVRQLKSMPLDQIAAWFTQHPQLAEILDRKQDSAGRKVLISEHEDSLQRVERGYGKAGKPEDYLSAFAAWIKDNGNQLPALIAVLQRPRELTRKQLREVALALDTAGFSESKLNTAWRDTTNQEIAASIIGYIRQAAIGDPLLPYTARVDAALQKILTQPPHGKPWNDAQRLWLKRIAAQTKANLIVDQAALEDPVQIFSRDGGGFARLDKLFDGQLQQVLASFNEALWDKSA